jgi:hypothetical protein
LEQKQAKQPVKSPKLRRIQGTLLKNQATFAGNQGTLVEKQATFAGN